MVEMFLIAFESYLSFGRGTIWEAERWARDSEAELLMALEYDEYWNLLGDRV